MPSDAPIDLIVYGATGFTGRQLLRRLADTRSTGTSWAAAGRRPDALAAVAEDARTFVAPLDDPAALRRMTAQARVIVNLAGPYRPHAAELIDACIDTATHYADISGEIPFTRQLIGRYHNRAVDAGVAVITQCGYEAAPFDLITARLHEALMVCGTRLARAEVVASFTFATHPIRVGAGVSGGTVATTVAFAHEIGPGQLTDPFALVADPGDRVANRIDLRARRAAGSGHWLAPLAPAPFVNPAVVHRTNALSPTPYAPGFTYHEAFDTTRSFGRAVALPAARSLAALASSITRLADGQGSRRDRRRLQLIGALGPRPGHGPRTGALDRLGFRLDVDGTGEDGRTAHAWLDGRGNPGYRATPNLLAEAGRRLAADGPITTGCTTPALALGTGFLDSLTTAGFTHAVDVTDHRDP